MPKTIEIFSHMPRLHFVGAGHGPAVKDGDTVKPGPKHGKLTIKPGSNDIDAVATGARAACDQALPRTGQS